MLFQFFFVKELLPFNYFNIIIRHQEADQVFNSLIHDYIVLVNYRLAEGMFNSGLNIATRLVWKGFFSCVLNQELNLILYLLPDRRYFCLTGF